MPTTFTKFRFASKALKKLADPATLSIIVVFISYMIYNSLKKFYTSKPDPDLTKKFIDATKIRSQVRIYDSQKPDMLSTHNALYISTGLIDLGLTDNELIALLIHDNAYRKSYHTTSLASDVILTGVLAGVADSLRERSGLRNIPSMAMYFAFLIMISEGTIEMSQSLINKAKDNRSLNIVKKFGYGPDLLSAYKKIIASEKEHRIPCNKICQLFQKIENILERNPELKEKLKKVLSDKDVQIAVAKNTNPQTIKDTIETTLQQTVNPAPKS